MMNWILVPFKAILGILSLITNILYKVRDLAWDYPSFFLEDNPRRENIIKTYQTGAPYSHFILAVTSMVILLFPLVFGKLPKVISNSGSQLLEGVVMGGDDSGNVQQLSKINPIFPSNIQLEKDLVEMIYEPLLRFNYVPFGDEQIGGVEYVLAQDISTITPGSDYIFELRKDVYWHDHDARINDHKLTADDVIATVGLLSNLDIDISTTRAVKQLQWEKLDDYRIRICTKSDSAEDIPCALAENKPIFSNFLELLSFKVLPESGIADIDNTTVNTSRPNIYRSPIGTGKYKFDGASSEGISVQKNKNYYKSNLIRENIDELSEIVDSRSNILERQDTNVLVDEITAQFDLEGDNELFLTSIDVSLKVNLAEEGDALFIDSFEVEDLDSIDSIKFVYFRDVDTSIKALKNAEIHAVATTSVSFRNDLRNFTQITTTLSPILYNQFWAVYFNLRTRPDGSAIGPGFLLDQNVRKAIAYSVDKEGIVQEALKEVGTESSGPIPNISYYFNDNAEWPTYNTEIAEKLFEDAGWTIKDGDFYRTDAEGNIMSFSLSFVESFDRRQVVDAMKSDLADVGVEVFTERELENLPDFIKDINIRKAISNYLFNNTTIKEVREDYPDHVSSLTVPNFLIEQGELYSSVLVNVDQTLDDKGWLMQEDGFRYRDNQKMMIEINLVDDDINRAVAEVFKTELSGIGIDVSLNYLASSAEGVSWGLQELNDQLLAPRLFDTILYGMNRFIDPEMYELYHSTQSADPGLNIASYESDEITVDKREDRQEGESSLVQVPKVDKFLEQARSFDPVNNRVDRKEKYDDIQRILANEVPVIYIYHPQFLYYSNNALSSLDLSLSKSIEERFRNVERWVIE